MGDVKPSLAVSALRNSHSLAGANSPGTLRGGPNQTLIQLKSDSVQTRYDRAEDSVLARRMRHPAGARHRPCPP